MSREDLLRVVRTVWQERDPVPDGLVARMQEAAALAASGQDLDVELMQLVEGSAELAGTRGDSASYTLRYRTGETDLLLRVAVEGDESRIDGWIVPPEPMTVHVVAGEPGGTAGPSVPVSAAGRFELSGLRRGLIRLRLEVRDPDRPVFVTPTFEI